MKRCKFLLDTSTAGTGNHKAGEVADIADDLADELQSLGAVEFVDKKQQNKDKEKS